MKKYIAIIATFLVTACAVTQQDGVMESQERSGGFMGLSKREPVEVNTGSAFKGLEKVTIGSFKVGFNESKRLQNKAGGGLFSSGFGGKSTGLVKLEGIDDSVRQTITDELYTKFVAELETAGYTIVDRTDFVNSEEYDGTKEYDFPYEDDDSGIFSSYGVGYYFSPTAIGKKQPIFLGEVAGVTGGIGFSNPASAAAEYAKRTGVAVLNVSFMIDFAGAGGHGGKWTSYSTLKVGQLLSVDQGILGVTKGWGGTFSDKVGSLTLGQPLASEEEFATIENISSEAEVGIETALNVVSAFTGNGTNQTREFVFHADAEKFKSAASDALSQATKRFIDKMTALR